MIERLPERESPEVALIVSVEQFNKHNILE
jgi:hypothetical protein